LADAREKLFDGWAASYDRSVGERSGFPFEGYERVLDLVADRACAAPGMLVLDLGIGTGNLAGRMLERGCVVWGLDFSVEMLAKAHARYPGVELVKADIRGDWPIDVDRRFDRIVSAYVLHEFDLASKIRLIRKLVCDHLVDDGRVVVGGISFETCAARKQAERAAGGRWNAESGRWEGRVWDDDEHYWAANETLAALAKVGLTANYEQVSFCGGVYVIEHETARCDGAGPAGGRHRASEGGRSRTRGGDR
jgi:cyclopropane fatty-acyl-phospholipid synthase-like methyltransferase